MALTGKFTFRKSLWGKIIVQVEEEVTPFWRRSSAGAPKRRWRDARVMDLADPELRHLVDLRFRPYLRSLAALAPDAMPTGRDRAEAQAEVAPLAVPAGGTRPEATVIRIAH